MEKFNLRDFIRIWIIPSLLEIAVLLFIFNFICVLTFVPTGSMIPTISEGSLLVTTKMYSKDALKRGDIVSFNSDELDKLLIKRLIGLPGEKVEIAEDGSLFIDGEKLDEWYVINGQKGAASFQVPDGHYLFFGDNRAGSYDARGWNDPYIPKSKLIGKALFTLWPLGNFGVLK